MGYSNKLPWLSQGLKSSIKMKNRLYAIHLKHPTQNNTTIYKNYKNRLNHILRNTERKYFQNQLQQSQNNLRNSWKIIKNIINKKKNVKKTTRFMINGSKIEDPSLIAEAFNNFFINIGQVLDKKISTTTTHPTQFIPKNYTINIFLKPATEIEI